MSKIAANPNHKKTVKATQKRKFKNKAATSIIIIFMALIIGSISVYAAFSLSSRTETNSCISNGKNLTQESSKSEKPLAPQAKEKLEEAATEINLAIKNEPATQNREEIKKEKKANNFKYKTNKLKVKLGDNVNIDFSGNKEGVKFESSNKYVANFNKKNEIIATHSGSTVITAKNKDGSKSQCQLTITEPDILVNSIELNYIGIDFTGVCENKLVVTDIIPSYATMSDVYFESSNENVALVNQNGDIASVGNGWCEVICKSADGNAETRCPIYVTGITENMTKAVEDMKAKYLPQSTNNETQQQSYEGMAIGEAIVAKADTYVGKLPYVWGGTSLEDGADCSGFVCALYDSFGINLWGYRVDLNLVGQEITDINEAKAGDILCYYGHIALYDGNYGRIHEPDIGCTAQHDYGYWGNPYTIRRVLN